MLLPYFQYSKHYATSTKNNPQSNQSDKKQKARIYQFRIDAGFIYYKKKTTNTKVVAVFFLALLEMERSLDQCQLIKAADRNVIIHTKNGTKWNVATLLFNGAKLQTFYQKKKEISEFFRKFRKILKFP